DPMDRTGANVRAARELLRDLLEECIASPHVEGLAAFSTAVSSLSVRRIGIIGPPPPPPETSFQPPPARQADPAPTPKARPAAAAAATRLRWADCHSRPPPRHVRGKAAPARVSVSGCRTGKRRPRIGRPVPDRAGACPQSVGHRRDYRLRA